MYRHRGAPHAFVNVGRSLTDDITTLHIWWTDDRSWEQPLYLVSSASAGSTWNFVWSSDRWSDSSLEALEAEVKTWPKEMHDAIRAVARGIADEIDAEIVEEWVRNESYWPSHDKQMLEAEREEIRYQLERAEQSGFTDMTADEILAQSKDELRKNGEL